MKTIKNFNSFVNENIKTNESAIETELDEDIVEHYLEIIEAGGVREDAIIQVANDFGIDSNVVEIVLTNSDIRESVEVIEEGKKDDKKEDKKEDKKDDKEDDKKDDKKEEDKKDDKCDDKKDCSDEDKYLSAGQKKLPEGLKKAIIKKAKAKK